MRQVDRRTNRWAPPEQTWATMQPGSSQEGNTPPVSALRPPSRACLTHASLGEVGEMTACLAVTPPGPARGAGRHGLCPSVPAPRRSCSGPACRSVTPPPQAA